MLDLHDTKVTNAGLKELRKALPNCLVNWTLVAP
jgi:hypothetical protein